MRVERMKAKDSDTSEDVKLWPMGEAEAAWALEGHTEVLVLPGHCGQK